MNNRLLASLQFKSTRNYDDNLKTLMSLIEQTTENSVILAPEVCLTGFDYENFEKAALFSIKAIDEIVKLSKNRIIILTVIEKEKEGKYFNVAKIIHNEKVVHEQRKTKLFKNEKSFFSAGDTNAVKIFTVGNVKFGILICFELRFKEYWQKLEGADIILIPARWGKNRTKNFQTLTEALAIMNQCYVIAADASNDECTSMSGTVTPFGNSSRNGNALCLIHKYNKQEIFKMRRYLNVGI